MLCCLTGKCTASTVWPLLLGSLGEFVCLPSSWLWVSHCKGLSPRSRNLVKLTLPCPAITLSSVDSLICVVPVSLRSQPLFWKPVAPSWFPRFYRYSNVTQKCQDLDASINTQVRTHGICEGYSTQCDVFQCLPFIWKFQNFISLYSGTPFWLDWRPAPQEKTYVWDCQDDKESTAGELTGPGMTILPLVC